MESGRHIMSMDCLIMCHVWHNGPMGQSVASRTGRMSRTTRNRDGGSVPLMGSWPGPGGNRGLSICMCDATWLRRDEGCRGEGWLRSARQRGICAVGVGPVRPRHVADGRGRWRRSLEVRLLTLEAAPTEQSTGSRTCDLLPRPTWAVSGAECVGLVRVLIPDHGRGKALGRWNSSPWMRHSLRSFLTVAAAAARGGRTEGWAGAMLPTAQAPRRGFPVRTEKRPENAQRDATRRQVAEGSLARRCARLEQERRVDTELGHDRKSLPHPGLI
jgi:hypothetical protein